MGYSNKTFVCPFFSWDERLCIHCEGGRIRFPDRQTAGEYIDQHCASVDGWRSCTVARMLETFYDGRNERERRE